MVLLGFLLAGCGGQEVDLEDELKGKEDYELVLLSQPKSPEKKAAPALVDTSLRPAGAGDTAAAAALNEAPAVKPIAYDPAGEFTVQIGTYDEARLAGERVKQLSAEGYPAYALANSGNKGARVRIGYFKTRDEAEHFGQIFKKDKGAEFWVDRRANEKL
ncbi:MAG: SPOR domain-containing protein [Candidatus Latescibacteria bacterium]|nr:SPOR domain-containing protein [Candidatus Latescibacterota bacterium]